MTEKFKHPLKLMIVLGWAIAISLYSVTPTFAKGRPGNVSTTVPTTKSRVEPLSRLMSGNSDKVRTVRVKLVSPDGKELTKLSPAARKKIMASLSNRLKEAGVSAVNVEAGWGCFGECLGTLGVSPWQVVACGVACALWETGAGLILCAICVGYDVTAVTGCGLYCGAILD